MNFDVMVPHRKAVSYCTSCPKMCRFACPVALASGREADTPTAKAHVVQQVTTGKLALSEETAATFYRCTDCLHARAHCEHRIEPAAHFQAARVLAVSAGVEPAAVRRVDDAIRRTGNPFGRDLSAVAKDLIPSARRMARAPVAYFPGCVALAHLPDLVRATIRLLESLGVEFAVFDTGDSCTGYPALSGGYVETFRRQARKQEESLRHYGTVVTSCPACAHTLESSYPEHGFPLPGRVAHITEFLADHLGAVRPAARDGGPAAYHDPCFLGRRRRTYETPRALLGRALGKAAVEFPRNRSDAGCCGAGGLLPRSSPDVARAIGRTRLAEFAGLGAKRLVTACPSCQRWYRKLDPALAVADVVELLAP